jgi:prephenate dehydrogenase
LARGERPLRTVISPSPRHPQAAERARELFIDLGCQIIEQNPSSHDRAMASTHALAFFIAKGLLDMGVDADTMVAPPSFQGMQNMLAAVRGDAGHLFAAIQQENPFAAAAREQLLAALHSVHCKLMTHGDAALNIPALPEVPP